jgi:hypothetical protein
MAGGLQTILTGLGLSGSAGLNAYLPLLILGVMQRADAIELAEPYDLVGHPAVLGLLMVLLIVEMIADKIPAVDSLNDMVNTGVRPAAGALLFTASTSTMQDADPTMLTVASLLSGGVSAGVIHAAKTIVRPGVTASTAGIGNPFVSLFEDIISTIVSLFAVLLPFVVLLFTFSVIAILGWWVWDWQRGRKYFAAEAPIVIMVDTS